MLSHNFHSLMLMLPQTLFRVWDIFLVDGMDVLFRIAFSILRMSEQELLHCASIPAVYVALESLPNRMWETDKLLQVTLLYKRGSNNFTDALYSTRRSCARRWSMLTSFINDKHIWRHLDNAWHKRSSSSSRIIVHYRSTYI